MPRSKKAKRMKWLADWYQRRRETARALRELSMHGGDRFGALRVSEADIGSRRWEIALELLRDGKTMLFEDIGFCFEKDMIVVTAESSETDTTLAKADEKFENALLGLEMLRARDVRFRELLAGRRVKLELIYDYGMGAVLLAVREGENSRLA